MSESKGKDSLMKMLLSSGPSTGMGTVPLPPPPPPPPPGPPRYSTPTSSIPSPSSDIVEESCPTLGTYLNQVGIAGQNSGFNPWSKVYLDHNYAKPGSESYSHGYMKPTKTLFINKPTTAYSIDELIDVDVDRPQSKPPYDLAKAQEAMEECEKNVAQSRTNETEASDWEENISKAGWNTSQTNLFNKVVKILQNDRLARLAHSDCRNEPVLRRISVDKSAQRFREALSSVMWDIKLVRWLHSLLVDHLGTSYLAAYLEILQTLRRRIPTLIDKMVGSNNQVIKGVEGLNPLLKPPWDPVGPSIAQHKLKKLPGNPVIIMVPSRVKKQSMSHRAKLWHSHLSDLGTVVTVSPSMYNFGPKVTTQVYLAHLVTATKGRLAEVRVEYPRRPIILVGWRSGAALACQVAVTEPVSAVVCLGFSSSTVEGHRGEPDDFLLDVRCPVLFVVGENASTSRQEDMEEIREKMRYQTDLLVVGHADDCLRMGKSKKRMEGVTQSMVDRCILEEIGDFLAGVLISPKPIVMSNDFRREIYGRRRHNSTTSSVDSESSVAKRSRPGTPQQQVGMGGAQKAQVNGGLKVSPAKPLPRGRRPGSGKKASKLLMNTTLQANTINQVSNANGGITVNIGSLASLGPIGPLRMGGVSTAGSSSGQMQAKSPQSLVDAAPPEMVMPIRDTPEDVQEMKIGSPQGKQVLTKGITRLLIGPFNNALGNIVQTVPGKGKMLPGTRLTLPARTNASDDKKQVQSVRYVIASDSRLSTNAALHGVSQEDATSSPSSTPSTSSSSSTSIITTTTTTTSATSSSAGATAVQQPFLIPQPSRKICKVFWKYNRGA